MVIHSVGDLKAYLESQSLSPEEAGKLVGISNMTIRRLLKKKPSFQIPKKYWPLFDGLVAPDFAVAGVGESLGFEKLLSQIESDGLNCKNPSATFHQATKKAQRENLGIGIASLVRELGKSLAAKRPLRSKAIAVGALLYFLNPVDLVPDTVPFFGYVDDFAVLSIAASVIRKNRKSESDAKNADSDGKRRS